MSAADGLVRNQEDAGAIPATLTISDGWQSSNAPVAADKNGAFHFAGVPAELIQLLLHVPGYQLTPQDHLLKFGSSTNLDIVTDMTNLVIEMRPKGSR